MVHLTDMATVSLISLWVPTWLSEPTDLSDPVAAGQYCRDLGAVSENCSFLGWEDLTGTGLQTLLTPNLAC